MYILRDSIDQKKQDYSVLRTNSFIVWYLLAMFLFYSGSLSVIILFFVVVLFNVVC